MGGEELADLGAFDDVFEFVGAGLEAERALAVVPASLGSGPAMVPKSYGGGQMSWGGSRGGCLQVGEPDSHVGPESNRREA